MRLGWWTAGLMVGVACALFVEATLRDAIVVGVPAVAAALVLVWRRRGPWAEVLVAGAVGFYVGARAGQVPALPAAVMPFVDQENETEQMATLQGWVTAAPEVTSAGARQGSRLRVRADRINGAPLVARLPFVVALSVVNGVPAVLPGDRVQFAARLRSVRGLANPGVSDGTLSTRVAGIDVFAGVASAAAIQVVSTRAPPEPMLSLLRAAARVRMALARTIDRLTPGTTGVFLHTAVLGERRATDAVVESGFRAAGTTHLLSVSGLHLAAIALVFFGGIRLALAAVPRLPLWIPVRATAALAAIPAIAFYTLVTGAAVATVRSALMMTFALGATVIGRRNTAAGAIGAAVLLLLAWSPLVVADVSFQLSLVSVLALTWLAPHLVPDAVAARDQPGGHWQRGLHLHALARWLARMAAASLAAGLTTAPLVAHTFGEVAPAAPLGNLVLVPLVELVVVPFGLAGAALGAWGSDAAGAPLLAVAAWAARAALAIAEQFRLHAPVWLTRAPGPFETLALSVGFACVLVGWRDLRARRPSAWVVAAAIALAAGAGSLAVQELRRRWNPDVIITFLDVGQGDAAVIQVPGGHTVLIDGGGTYDGSFDPGARVIEPFLRARGIVGLDLVALSHPHPDHQGGLHRIVSRFPVGALWTSGDDGRNPDYHLLLREARVASVATPLPERWHCGGLTLEPLGPFVTEPTGAGGVVERVGPTAGVSVNDASLVLRAAFGGRAVLFTGDVEADGEGELCGRTSVGQTVASDVLKVPHHGSRTSSSDELLQAVRPALAVMSLGWRNRFRFPRPEVVQRYRERGICLLRTDLNGAVTVTITPAGAISTRCQRGCRAID